MQEYYLAQLERVFGGKQIAPVNTIATTGYSQVVEMTDEEKQKMYNEFPKEEIIKMLISANKFIETLTTQVNESNRRH